MSRQRITVFNPGEGHDPVIKLVGATKLQFASEDPLLVEVKTTFENTKSFEHIRLPQGIRNIRITYASSKHIPADKYPPVFQYFYQRGWSIYLHVDKEIEDFTMKLFAIPFEEIFGNFVLTMPIIVGRNKYYFSFPEVDDPRNVLERVTLQKVESEIDALELLLNRDSPSVVKYLYETNEVEVQRSSATYKEVGLFLQEEQLTARDDIVLSGVRVVYDPEDEVPLDDDLSSIMFKTLFHVKPRYRVIDTIEYESTIEPNGLHPVLVTNFNHNISRIFDEDIYDCHTYYYLNLNRSLFIDRYQLPENQILISNQGYPDLEAPGYVGYITPTELLIELTDLNFGQVKLQLHSRYQEPKKGDPQTTIMMNQPIIFQSCSVNDIDLDAMAASPFDNKQHKFGGNYEAYFTPNSVFYNYKGSSEQIPVTIPNGSSDLDTVTLKTIIVITLGLAFVFYKLIRMFIMSSLLDRAKKTQ